MWFWAQVRPERRWPGGHREEQTIRELTNLLRARTRGVFCHVRSDQASHGRERRRTPPRSCRRVVSRANPPEAPSSKADIWPFFTATSGACATIASDAFMNPFDVIKQRMQLHGSTYRSISDCARTVWRNEGFKAFYVSYPTTLTMTVPFTALQFMAYESLTKVMQRKRRAGYDPLTHCTAGGLAGGFAAAATTPLDVVKTLLQTRGVSNDAEIRHARGLWVAAGIIWRREGVKGFFRGMKARVVTAAPSTAICWSAYEVAKAYFIRIEGERK